MKVLIDGKEARIEDMVPGDFFGFSIRNEFHLGLAVPPRNIGEGPGLIALHPGHPDLNGQPGILLASTIRNWPILHFPTAMVVPSPNFGDMHIGFTTMNPAPGSLLIADGQHLVAVVFDSSIRLFSVEDGSPYNFDTPMAIWYSVWKIVLPIDNGQHKTLCTIEAKGSS